MNSLVLELQSEARNSSSSILNLLRKAYFVAYKLDIQELQKWINFELKGYTNYSLLPKYRFVRGELIAHNPQYGWIPVNIGHAEISNEICRRPFGEAISQLEDVIYRESDSYLVVPIPKEMELQIMSWIGFSFPIKLQITVSQIQVILDAVKNIILNWSLRLERDEILGEGMTFPTTERKAASNTTYHVKNLYNCSSVRNIMSETMIEQNNSSIGIGVNQGEVKTRKLAGTINEAQSQSLAESARDIQQLLKQLSQSYPTETLTQKAVVAEKIINHIESDSKFKQKVINAVKTGSFGALEKAIDNPIGAFIIEGIKGWQEIE